VNLPGLDQVEVWVEVCEDDGAVEDARGALDVVERFCAQTEVETAVRIATINIFFMNFVSFGFTVVNSFENLVWNSHDVIHF
jgi:hypothetical protein